MERFNTYIEHINPGFWRELCVSEGMLRHFERGEEFVRVGEVARYIGYIQSGTVKYVAYSDDGTEHVVGMEGVDSCCDSMRYILFPCQGDCRPDENR